MNACRGESSLCSGRPRAKIENFRGITALEHPSLTARDTQRGGVTHQGGCCTGTRSGSRDSLPKSWMAGEWSVGFQARSPGPGILMAWVVHLGC